MATSNFVAADVLGTWLGAAGRQVALVLSVGIVLGAISSTIVSCVRVPFALARDGLAFRFIGNMSRGQAPVGALMVAAGFTVLFTLTGAFSNVLSIYTISAGVLFGLVNLSLLIFRRRDRSTRAGQPDHFRCPAGPLVSVILALTQFII